MHYINKLRPGQMAANFLTFSNTFSWMKYMNSIEISLKFVPKGLINNILALVQIMAWRRPGEKPILTNDDKFIGAYMRHSASMSEHMGAEFYEVCQDNNKPALIQKNKPSH